MAIKLFNRAVDFFVLGDDPNCQIWAEKALNLAAEQNDGGVLGNNLRKNYARMKFGSDDMS